MTILRTIVKNFFLSRIEKYTEDSKVSDGMYGSTFRDLALSKIKREIASALHKNISELNIEGNDEVFLNQIQKYIQTAKVEAQLQAANAPGSFEELMNYLVVLACSIKFKLENIALIDVEYDETEALSVFSYHVALYYTEAIMVDLDSRKGLVNKLIQLQKGQWKTDLSDDKDTLLSDALISCRENIDALGEAKPTYEHFKIKEVTRTIEEVKSKNAQLCRERGVDPKVSIGLTFFSKLNLGLQSYKPSKGKLEKYMDEAHEAVKAIDANLAPVAMNH